MIWAPHIRTYGNATTDDHGYANTYDDPNRLVTTPCARKAAPPGEAR